MMNEGRPKDEVTQTPQQAHNTHTKAAMNSAQMDEAPSAAPMITTTGTAVVYSQLLGDTRTQEGQPVIEMALGAPAGGKTTTTERTDEMELVTVESA